MVVGPREDFLQIEVVKPNKIHLVIRKERKGIFISTAGSGSDTIFDCSRKTIKAFFDVLNIKYDRDFTYKNIDFKGDILKIPQALEEVFEYGKNLLI